MNVCCAYTTIREAVAAMKAADPAMSGVPDEQFMFTPDEVYQFLQTKYSIAEIQELVDTLVPELEQGNPCACGTTNVEVCGMAFVAIIDEMFDRPAIQ